MSYGFRVTTGTGSTVTIDSDEANAPGVFLDYFNVPYNTTVYRSYAGFAGAQIFVMPNSANSVRFNFPVVTVNNTTKELWVQAPVQTPTAFQTGINVLVMGK